MSQAINPSDKDKAEWKAFKAEYNKKYDTEEEDNLRMKFFMENKLKIAEHNLKYDSGNVTWTMGINQFADLGPDESPCSCSKGHSASKH